MAAAVGTITGSTNTMVNAENDRMLLDTFKVFGRQDMARVLFPGSCPMTCEVI